MGSWMLMFASIAVLPLESLTPDEFAGERVRNP